MKNAIGTTSEATLGFIVTSSFTTLDFESHLKSLAGPKDFYVGLIRQEGKEIILSLRENIHQPAPQFPLPFDETIPEIALRIFKLLTLEITPHQKQRSSLKYFSEHVSHVSLNDGNQIPITGSFHSPLCQQRSTTQQTPPTIDKTIVPDPEVTHLTKNNDETENEVNDSENRLSPRNLIDYLDPSEPRVEFINFRLKSINFYKGEVRGRITGSDIIILVDKETKNLNLIPELTLKITVYTSLNGIESREISSDEISRILSEIQFNLN